MPALTLYAIGPRLHRCAVDPETGELAHAESVKLPGNGQYAVFHPGGNFLYVATGKPPQPPFLLAFAIDAASGALRPHGAPVPLPTRAIHLDIDPAGLHLFVSMLATGTVQVVRLHEDGRIGVPLVQSGEAHLGVFLHQARVAPSGAAVLACARGNDAANGKPEEKGALSLLTVSDGALHLAQQIEMPAGVGPRHLDYNADGTRAYLAAERGNTLRVLAIDRGRIGAEPLFCTTTLADPDRPAAGQRAGAIHLHPSGRFAYVSNRGQLDPLPGGGQAFGGGENSIAAFALDESPGCPVLMQHAPVHGLEPRSFAIDPSGRWLIAANQYQSTHAPAAFDVFAIAADGRLHHRHSDVSAAEGVVWVGFATAPSAGARA